MLYKTMSTAIVTFSTLALLFLASIGVVLAQSPSPTVQGTSTTLPSGAPTTGRVGL